MSYYNHKHVVSQMTKGIVEKLQNLNKPNDVTAVFTHSYGNTIALNIIVRDISLTVPGFTPNYADYTFEIWFEGSVVEDGKLIKCGDTYSLCWDEIDGLIEWYVKDTFDTTNDRKRVVEIEGEYDLGLSYGKRELARQMKDHIIDALGDSGIESIARYAMENSDLHNVDFSNHA